MLQISTRSWHYRWLRFMWETNPFASHCFPRWARDKTSFSVFEPPKNICTYFWTGVGLTAATPLFGIAVIFIISGVWLITLLKEMLKWPLIVPIIFIVAGLVGLTKKMRPEKKEAKPRSPSLTWEYIKAKKQKACPLIEYRGD